MTTSRRAALAVIVVAIAASALLLIRRPRAPQEEAYRANNLGVAALEQFDYDLAARSFRQALAADPALAIARLNLAIALMYGGDLAAAEQEARAISTGRSDWAHAHYVLGLVLRSQNRSDEAISAFARVRQIDPLDAGTAVNLAQIYLEQRNSAEAVTEFNRALEVEPYNATAAYGLATALARAGSTDAAAKAMASFEALRTRGYATTYSQAYLGHGKYAEARASTGLEAELVDETTPAVTYSDATSTVVGAAADAPSHALALADLDDDDDLDLVLVSDTSVRTFDNAQGRFTFKSELPIGGMQATAVATGDVDNDGRADLFVAGGSSNRLIGQQADGTLVDLTNRIAQPAAGSDNRAIALSDVDHDGDLDVMLGGPLQLLRNNGNGTFTDTTVEAGLSRPEPAVQLIAATDYDNRRDIDVLVVSPGRTPALFRNLRDGRFRDVASAVGFPPPDAYSGATVADVNKDGLPDFFLGRTASPGVFVMSSGVDRFQVIPAPDGTAGASAAMFVDYDNDGLLDLVTLTPRGPKLWRQVSDRWVDVTATALPAALQSSADPLAALVMGDVDSDGDQDAIVRSSSGRLHVWRNDAGRRNQSIRVRLAAKVSNRTAAGAKVEIRAGSLRQTLETSASAPAVAPANLVFGLGHRASADVVRVLWPAGILQAETMLADRLTITELDRKPSSCPFLFTWNGSRFEFVTDFMGGGEMGYWAAPFTWNHPDPDEYVRIRGDQLQPRDGRYEIVVTNELEEATFTDRLELWAVDHAVDVAVFPNEGLKAAPPSFRLFTTRHPKPPAAAVDDHGHDALSRIASIDRQYVDDFALVPIRGYAEPHSLTLDLGSDADRAVLLLTGWTDYAFSSDNVAAHQAGIAMSPPVLQVRDAGGSWRTAVPDVGIPVGRPQTLAVDLRGKFLSASREVRLLTNMRIYWDQILVDRSGGELAVRTTRSRPLRADLTWRGFSAPVLTDGREPESYDYARVSPASPWKVLAGAYTRQGDVGPLLEHTDDMFVISMPGDQIALSFLTSAFPSLSAGHTRTFLLYADGYSKEMNSSSASPDHLAPLPFHGMRRYPYGPDEVYPSTAAHREYLDRYNTRIVTRPIPSIDTATHSRTVLAPEKGHLPR